MKRRPVSSISVAPSPRSALCGERRGIAADGDGRGMELHELGVADRRAGAGGHAEALTAGFERVGGDGVECADATGGEDDRLGAEEHEARAVAAAVAGKDAGDAAVLQRQFESVEAFHDLDRRCREGALGDGACDLGAGAVALDVHDTLGAVRGLTAKREATVGGAVGRGCRRRAGRRCGQQPCW